MIKSIRKKVASTVAGIEKTQDFAWGKWLKEPAVKEHRVEGFEASLTDTSHLNSWLVKPAVNKRKFDFRETFILPEHKNLFLKKVKTNTVFFGVPKAEVRKINLMQTEFSIENKPREISFKPRTGKLKEVNWKIPTSLQKDYPWQLEPKVKKINLLKAEALSVDKFAGKNSNVEFKSISSQPKIFKVKIVGLDKIKLSKIYFLKNISLHEVRLLRDSLKHLSKPGVEQAGLQYFDWYKESKPEVPLKPVVEPEKKAPEEIFSLPEKQITPEPVIETEFELPPEDFNLKETKQAEETIINGTTTAPDLIPEMKEPEQVLEEEEEAEEAGQSENEFRFLYPFQETGAEFLMDSKRAVLSDELGLGKTVQAVSALKNLFNNKKIKSAAVICNHTEIGNWEKIAGEADGWVGQLHNRAPELRIQIVDGTPQERSRKWKNQTDIFVLPVESFFFDIEENIVDLKEFKKINCLIFDEVQDLFTGKNPVIEKMPAAINPKYLWILSSHPENFLKENINRYFKDKLAVKNYLGRSRKEVEEEIPEITWENKWLSLDEEQIEEYNEAFNSAKEKVQWFLESGNPLRFNANVFTLLHQLKQVCNYSEKKGKSRKTSELIRQVSSIAASHKKVVIFSQYDKGGTKKIEELLKKNNIKFLSYAPGMSTKEMENVLKKFSNDVAVTALVTGVKPSRLKIPGDISYVIHFDIWWNPASLWQTEEAIVGNLKGGQKEKLNVYSYLMKGTIEEKIQSMLFGKGFLNKQIMETVNPDSIAEMITNPEWLEIFDMPDEEFKQRYKLGLLETEKRIDNYSPAEFAERGKIFFTKLGYKNLDISENKKTESFDIKGILKKAKVDILLNARLFYKDFVSEDEINSNLAELKRKTNNGKYFIITRGTFQGDEILHTSEVLIDRSLLTRYFYQFIIL